MRRFIQELTWRAEWRSSCCHGLQGAGRCRLFDYGVHVGEDSAGKVRIVEEQGKFVVVRERGVGEVVAAHQAVAAVDDHQLGVIGAARGVEKHGDPFFFQEAAGFLVCCGDLFVVSGKIKDNTDMDAALPGTHKLFHQPGRAVVPGCGGFEEEHGQVDPLPGIANKGDKGVEIGGVRHDLDGAALAGGEGLGLALLCRGLASRFRFIGHSHRCCQEDKQAKGQHRPARAVPVFGR